MKRNISLLLLVIFLLVGCSSFPNIQERVIGEWVGTDSGGTRASLVFNEDKSAVMNHGDITLTGDTIGGVVEWIFDASVTPIQLDLVMSFENGQSKVLPMIVRFHDAETMEVRMNNDMSSRPREFGEADGVNQIILKRL